MSVIHVGHFAIHVCVSISFGISAGASVHVSVSVAFCVTIIIASNRVIPFSIYEPYNIFSHKGTVMAIVLSNATVCKNVEVLSELTFKQAKKPIHDLSQVR
jgi:flagellar motor component MotA